MAKEHVVFAKVVCRKDMRDLVGEALMYIFPFWPVSSASGVYIPRLASYVSGGL